MGYLAARATGAGPQMLIPRPTWLKCRLQDLRSTNAKHLHCQPGMTACFLWSAKVLLFQLCHLFTPFLLYMGASKNRLLLKNRRWYRYHAPQYSGNTNVKNEAAHCFFMR